MPWLGCRGGDGTERRVGRHEAFAIQGSNLNLWLWLWLWLNFWLWLTLKNRTILRNFTVNTVTVKCGICFCTIVVTPAPEPGPRFFTVLLKVSGTPGQGLS